MLIRQLIGVGFIVSLFGHHCNGVEYLVMSQDVEFTLFDPKLESIEAAVAVNGSTILDNVVSFLPLIRKALQTEPNWRDELAKAIGNSVRYDFAESDFRYIEHSFIEIRQIFERFKKSANDDNAKRQLTVDVEPILMILVQKVISGDSLFRLYPTLSLPALLTLTTFTFAIIDTLQQNAPDTEVFCLLRHAYDIYFQPIFLDRIRRIDISSDFNHHFINRNYLLFKQLEKKPSDNVEEVRCREESGKYDSEKAKLAQLRCVSNGIIVSKSFFFLNKFL